MVLIGTAKVSQSIKSGKNLMRFCGTCTGPGPRNGVKYRDDVLSMRDGKAEGPCFAGDWHPSLYRSTPSMSQVSLDWGDNGPGGGSAEDPSAFIGTGQWSSSYCHAGTPGILHVHHAPGASARQGQPRGRSNSKLL